MPISYEEYLNELKKRTRAEGVVFTFGRMNPPTVGHGKLIKKVMDVAKNREHRIYISQTQDLKKNPLRYESKIKFLRKMFPKANIIKDTSIKTPFDVFAQLENEKFEKVTMVVGDDRLTEFRKAFKRIDVSYKFNAVSSGKRDPDTQGVGGMSASKMRKFARDNNFKQFNLGLGETLSKTNAELLFKAVRKGMKLKMNETTHYIENDLRVDDIVEYLIDGSIGVVTSRTPTKIICEVLIPGYAYDKLEIIKEDYRQFSIAKIIYEAEENPDMEKNKLELDRLKQKQKNVKDRQASNLQKRKEVDSEKNKLELDRVKQKQKEQQKAEKDAKAKNLQKKKEGDREKQHRAMEKQKERQAAQVASGKDRPKINSNESTLNPAKTLAEYTNMSINITKKFISKLSVDEAYKLFIALNNRDFEGIKSVFESSESQLEVGTEKYLKHALDNVPGQGKVEIVKHQKSAAKKKQKHKNNTEGVIDSVKFIKRHKERY